MKTIAAEAFDPAGVVAELLDGGGAVRLPGVFDAATIREAGEIIRRETADARETGSHFNRDEDDALQQRRVWNLLAHGRPFTDIVQHPRIVDSMRAFLGTDFVMGSICASRTMPGFRGQEPHVDYPYWDLYRTRSFPARINASFPLNAQATILIDPFTEDNGATAYLPGSQKTLRYPTEEDRFFDSCERMTGEPGDVVLFFGATWHCAMPNHTDQGRAGILVEFLPKFVKPIEDLVGGLDPAFLETASPTLRQLLGFAYPWPSSPPHPPLGAEVEIATG
ncbi:MAG: phytanoyl-CoA dioxygenase family protein [Azospirillaceae bacterium]